MPSQKPFTSLIIICIDNNGSKCRNFKCSAMSAFKSNIYWSFKPCADNRCMFEYRNGVEEINEREISSNISLSNFESGYLQCFANNSYGNIEDTREISPFHGEHRQFINLNKQSSGYVIRLSTLEVTWNLTLEGYPYPELLLKINNDTKNCNVYHKYYCGYNENTVSVAIAKFADKDKNTTFSLIAKNEYESRNFKLNFDITKIAKVYIANGRIQKLTNNTTAICYADSILPCTLSWWYKTCFDGSCKYGPLMETTPKNFTLGCNSEIYVNSSLSGHLKCVANNSMDISIAYQRIHDIKKSLDICGNNSIIYDVDENTKGIQAEVSKPIILSCEAKIWNHEPDLTWVRSQLKRDDVQIDSSVTENSVFTYSRTLTLTGFGQNNFGGTYFCKARLMNGTFEYKKIEIIFKGTITWAYTSIALLSFLVLITVSLILWRVRKFRKLQREIQELYASGLANFEKGALEQINSNMAIEDQADLLPYDKTYEFPIKQLILGETIGSGAFGVVKKGEAKYLTESEPSTTVAVKMVNRNIGDIYIKSLVSELKIMIHLGKHINIVNVLGACTNKIAKKELFVITEYCRFGNLKDYISHHRLTFIDQINPKTGQIDFTIDDVLTISDLENIYSAATSLNTMNTSIEDKKRVRLESTEANEIHYKGDYVTINKYNKIVTRDLLLWSFQVARGMEYLSSRKVLHGDLAARNILLTDGNIVKICDFGLSKNLYQKEIYKKCGDGMLPVKWMAIEVITDKIFSIQSDVWSYGILLWEFFSLAQTPYHDMEYNEAFCENLLEGYRMEAPQFSTAEIYNIMLDCWDAEPTKRPKFSRLVGQIGSMLEDSLKMHYVDMNADYVKMNAKKFEDKTLDYLSMAGAPEFRKYSSPYRYVNFSKSLDNKQCSTHL